MTGGREAARGGGLLAAWGRADNDPRFIQARHEEMAAFAAAGYAKFTGEVDPGSRQDRPHGPAGTSHRATGAPTAPTTSDAPGLATRFCAMGHHAIAVARSTELVITAPTTVRAQVLERADDPIDDLQRELLELVTTPEAGYSVQGAIDVSPLVRFIERFADQAVGVARQLDFAVTGKYSNRTR